MSSQEKRTPKRIERPVLLAITKKRETSSPKKLPGHQTKGSLPENTL
jgi:hypothetical protein